VTILPALGKVRQEDHEFKASLGYTERPCLNRETIKGLSEIGKRRISGLRTLWFEE
jgi:hypothetical protein